jgi:mannosyl-3-phosphoglycerate phosphatase
MKTQLPLIVFTDLDGTLLSHSDYRWDAARPALERITNIGGAIVLASSKTAPEISTLRQEMGLQHWPAISENGAGLLAPHNKVADDRSDYARLRADMMKVPAILQEKFRGFGDMDVAEITDLTGLTPTAAQHACQRAFSEPGVWSGSDDEKVAFLEALAAQGISGREGGRFLTLSFGKTKADQMATIISSLAPRHTIAAGDAPNDVEMLEAADFGIIIANPNRAPLPLLRSEKSGRIMRTALAGPEGWNAAMLAHLARLKL